MAICYDHASLSQVTVRLSERYLPLPNEWAYADMSEQIVFVATRWGSHHGGVNTFNAEICRGVRSALPEQFVVRCVVLEASPGEVRDAGEAGIELKQIGASQHHEFFEEHRYLEILAALDTSVLPVAWWFGHDVITGWAALRARDESHQGKVGIFHHMDYLSYEAIKHPGSGVAATTKARSQNDLIKIADAVFAVGPRLAHNATYIRRDSTAPVIEIIPGLPEVDARHDTPPTFQAFVHGRMGRADDIIKQGRLAVAGVGRAIRRSPGDFGHDPRIVIVGVPAVELEQTSAELTALAVTESDRRLNVIVLPYEEDRQTLLTTLSESTVSMMVSLHEGFGLAGWEAIGATVPLIASRNSGLIDFITAKLARPGLECISIVDVKGPTREKEPFSDSDVDTVSTVLVALVQRTATMKRSAVALRDMLAQYTWKSAAVNVIEACGLASIFVRGQAPGEYVNKILEGDDFVEEYVTKRSIHFAHVWPELSAGAGNDRRLVLFGGISSDLRNDAAAVEYAVWLIRNGRARLFVCYETGKAAEARAASLDVRKLEERADLPATPLERMQEKEKQVVALRDALASFLSVEIMARVYFIPINMALTNYTILTTHNLYVAPVLQRRSSETASMKLPRRRTTYRTQLLEYMMFILSQSDRSEASLELERELLDALDERFAEVESQGNRGG